MDIAVGLPTNLRDFDRDLVLDWSRDAEQAGFSSLGMGERLSYAGYDWCVSLTAAAAVTTTIRLLSNIVILPIHPIGVIAKQALSLDAFSNGRLSLGVGIGAPEYDYDVAGVSPEGKWRRMEDHLVTLRSIWRGESQIDGLRPIGPSAVRDGGPELLLGALGPKSFGASPDSPTASSAGASSPTLWRCGRCSTRSSEPGRSRAGRVGLGCCAGATTPWATTPPICSTGTSMTITRRS